MSLERLETCSTSDIGADGVWPIQAERETTT